MVACLRMWGIWSCLAIGVSPILAQESPDKPPVAASEEPTKPVASLDSEQAAKLEFFEKKIRPLLVNNCYNCHSANTKAAGGLRVDDHRGLLGGGNSGSAIVPGSPADSILIQAVKYETFEMPPKKKLDDEQIADLEKWVLDGAVWPKTEVAIDFNKQSEKYDQLKREHWAWQPIKNHPAPAINDLSWPRDPLDHFVLAKLEQQGLKPVADADKVTLIRRVTFDLAGLPPTQHEIDTFLADTSANAFDKVVDRLLAATSFGERFGRHWLDVARYGESTGSARNLPYPHAWRYRDYVISAVNQDKPYDQFIREQIAGDLLPAASDAQREEQLVATGFLALGVKDVNQRFKVRFIMDNIDEQIDTVSRSILGVTASCARCHDHKFDPIPTKDYYALAGIFQSTDLCAGLRNRMGGGGLDYYDTSLLLNLGPASAGVSAETAAQIEELKTKVAEARKAFETLRDSPEGAELAPNGRPKRQVARQKFNRLQQELSALTDPAANGKVAYGVREAKTIADTEIRIRGEAEKLGPIVPRGFLTTFAVPDSAPINPSQSGRLELAQWLSSRNNPLTPRVLANRVWQRLFGQGLVTSVDNFGVTGDKPSHPELLDHLALRAINNGWSVKRLVRTIVLSRAYQLSGDATAAHLTADPANRWVWRHSPRRLDAEELRDAMLFASEKLKFGIPEGSPSQSLKVIEIRNNGNEAKQIKEFAAAHAHRSIYLPLVRDLTPTSLDVFDFAEQGMVTGSRDTTTVATQALYLLNDPFVQNQSIALAEQLLSQSNSDDAKRVHVAYWRLLGRAPLPNEVERALQFVAEYEPLAQETLASSAEAAAKRKAEAELAAKKKAEEEAAKPQGPVLDPDQVVLADIEVAEELVQLSSAKTAAWASFCQALLGSAEFRYLR